MATQRKTVAKAAEAEEVDQSSEDVKVHSKPRKVAKPHGNTCCGNLFRFLFSIGFLAAAAVGVSRFTTQTNFFGHDREVQQAYDEYLAQFMDKLHENNILLRPPPRPLQPEGTREAANKKEADAAAQQPAGEAAPPAEKKKKKKAKPYFDPAETETRTFTLAQLATYNGIEPEKPLLLAFKSKVYDVTKGKKHYGKGGAYHHFVGKDATRAFATGDFQNDLNGNLEGLTEEQIKSLDEWVGFYDSHKDYIYVGRLVPE